MFCAPKRIQNDQGSDELTIKKRKSEIPCNRQIFDDQIIDDCFNTIDPEVQVLLKKLNITNESNTEKNILNSLVILIDNPVARQYFKYNLERYCHIIATIITRIDSSTQFLRFIESGDLFHKNITERDDFSKCFIDVLLSPFISVLSKFHDDDAAVSVFEETSKIVQKCLFQKKIKTFDSYLKSFFEKQTAEEHSNYPVQRKLIKSLLKSYNLNESEGICAFKLIFHTFVKCYNNNDFIMIYRWFVICLELIGFDMKKKFKLLQVLKLQNKNALLSKSLVILSDMTKTLSEMKIQSDSVKLNDISFIDLMTDLMKTLMKITIQPDACCYKILSNVILINPLIIETVINEFIVYSILGDSVINNNQELYENLFIKVVEIFAKLHRMQSFISKLVPTLKQALLSSEIVDNKGTLVNETSCFKFEGIVDIHTDDKIDNKVVKSYDISKMFPDRVLKYFTFCLTNLASKQIINIVQTFVFHFDSTVNELASGVEESDPKLSIYVEILSHLICWLLSSVRMAEHTTNLNVVSKFVGYLEQFRDILQKFGISLLHRKHDHQLMTAFLNISYYWAEIYMTITYYSDSNELEMKKSHDNDYSCCNITYLHSYLTIEQWCLISERISNFGGKSCNKIMQKLFLQKLRAMLIFDNELNPSIISSVVKMISTNLDEKSLDLLSDKFFLSNLLHYMPTSSIVILADTILKEILDNNDDDNMKILNKLTHNIADSEIIQNALIAVVFKRIHNSMKQKRNYEDDVVARRSLLSKVYTTLPDDIFLYDNSEVTKYIDNIANVFLTESEVELDLKVIDLKKINGCLNMLKRFPVISCSEDKLRIVLLLLFCLQKDLNCSNCSGDLKENCENIIIGIYQSTKLSLSSSINCNYLIKLIVNDFNKYEELFTHFVQNIFKNADLIEQFRPGIIFLKDNLQENNNKYLQCTMIVLNSANKIKKTQMSTNIKNTCIEYKSLISHAIVNLIVAKEQPEIDLFEAYTFVLRFYLLNDENKCLKRLLKCLNSYLTFAFDNFNGIDDNPKGHLLLFATVLNNKSKLINNIDDDNNNVTLRIWNVCKTIRQISDDNFENYTQLINLIFGQIPNEEFNKLTSDLLSSMGQSIHVQNYDELIKYLKTCTSILTSIFNPIKTAMMKTFLEEILVKLIVILKDVSYNDRLYEEIVNFEISIIHVNQFLLTPGLIDIFLLSITTLMMNNESLELHFIELYNLSISIMDGLLKHRKPLILDRLPPYLQQYRILLKELCKHSNSDAGLDQSAIQPIADCAHQLEKLTRKLVACPKDMARISPYLIGNILELYEQINLNSNVKIHLNNCIYSLISICDQHAVAYLMRNLSSASTELFKLMNENYKKFYRFTGKV